MTVIADITAFNCTVDEQSLTAANSGWSQNTNSPFGGSGLVLRVTNASSPVSVFNDNSDHSAAYIRNETPGSANQTVRITIKRITDVVDTIWYALARVSTNNWVAATFANSSSAGGRCIQLYKCVGGTRTQVGSTFLDTNMLNSNGSTGVLELVVTGQSPNIQISAKWNGTEVIAPQTVTDSELNGVGGVGFQQRSFNGETSIAGYHVTAFYAEDDTGGGGGGTTLSQVERGRAVLRGVCRGL